MSRKLSVLLAGIVITSMMAAGCSKGKEEEKTAKPAEKVEAAKPTEKAASQTLTLKDYGPTDIKAGKDFNVQKGKYSAIWIHGENFTPNTIIVINETKLKGNKHTDDPSVLSTDVPKELFKTAGEYPMYLLDTKTGAKSNEIKFVVK